MKDADSSWPYWSIDLPGLSRSSAEELLQVAEQGGLSVSGSLVDPALFLTLHIDRETVDAVCAALSRVDWSDAVAGQPAAPIVNGFRELLQEWLNDALDE
jgi:hypothetical protein